MSPTAARTTKTRAAVAAPSAEDLVTADTLRTASEALVAAAEAISATAHKLSESSSSNLHIGQPKTQRSAGNREAGQAPEIAEAPEAANASSDSTLDVGTQAEDAQVSSASGMTIEEFLARELAAEAEREAREPDLSSLGHYLRQYGTYVAMFVGAGLISGSMVHFPLAPMRYLAIGACGAVLFSIASVAAELRKGPATAGRIARVIATALLLSIGIGMTSGGIQHFGDFPGRAAKLIPGGIGLSMTAFMIRDGYRLVSEKLLWLASGAVAVLIVLAIGLSVLAGSLAPTEGHSHGGSDETTATATATDGHATEASTETEAAQPTETAESHGH